MKNLILLLLGMVAANMHIIAQSSDENDPLGVDTTRIIQSEDIFLLWAEGMTQDAMYTHQKIFNQKLGVYDVPDTSMIDEVASHDKTNEWLIRGNQRMDLATGNFNYDQSEELIAVWEGPGRAIEFYLPEFDTSSNMWTNATQFEHPTAELPDYVLYQDRGRIFVKTADFDDDPLDELVLAYHDNDGTVHLELYETDWINEPMLLDAINNVSLPVSPSTFADYSINTGDYDGDGKDEIMLGVYNATSKKTWIYLYDIVDNKIEPTLNGPIRTSPNGLKDLSIVMTTGQFMNIDKEQTAIAISEWKSNNDLLITTFLLHSNESLDTIISTDYMQQLYSNSSKYLRLDVASGDLFGNNRDEIVFAIGKWLRVYTVNDTGEMELSYYINAMELNAGDKRASDNFLDVGDVNQDGHDEIVLARNFYKGDNQNFHLGIYTAGNNPDTIYRIGYKEQIAAYDKPNGTIPHSLYAFILGNFDGQDFRIGKPAHYTRPGKVQPLVILNAPPVHFDVFEDALFDINGCYSGGDCNFTSLYSKENTSEKELTTEVTGDWQTTAGFYSSGSVNVDFTTGANFGGVAEVSVGMSSNYENYLLGNYGRNFSKNQTKEQSVKVSSSIEAANDDLIYATVTDYEIFEYPIYNGTSKSPNGSIVVPIPQSTEARWFPSKSWTANSFIPNHEVGNILSYAQYADLDNNPDVSRPLKADLAEGYVVDVDLGYDWSIKFEDFKSEEDMENVIMGVDGKLQTGVVYFEANYSSTDMSTHKTTVSEGLEISMHLGKTLNRSYGNTRYTVTPYSYWAESGALVIDYMVKPELPQDQISWWEEYYGDHSDPTLILPWKNDPEKGYRLIDENERYKTSDISFEPANPQSGDTTIITARIRNFSLLPTPGAVNARFYAGDPDSSGVILTGTDGANVVSTDGLIDSRGMKTVELKWVVPAGYDEFTRIYVQLDPDDEIAEIHENNNKGWKTLGEHISFAAPEEPSSFDKTQYMSGNKMRLSNYPNPFNNVTNIMYSIEKEQDVAISISDISGRIIEVISDGLQFPGKHEITFDGSNLPEGIYFYSIQINNGIETGKMMISR